MLPTFDENLTATLRVDLGDWRDPITWRPEIFTDLAARSDFYVSLGFNPALTGDTPRKLPRQVDTAKRDCPAVVGLGRNVRGGTRPRLSCGRSSL